MKAGNPQEIEYFSTGDCFKTNLFLASDVLVFKVIVSSSWEMASHAICIFQLVKLFDVNAERALPKLSSKIRHRRLVRHSTCVGIYLDAYFACA